MDVYIEYLVSHKRNKQESLTVAGIIAAAVVLILAMYTVLPAFIGSLSGSWFGTIRFILAALIVYFAVILVRNQMLEYEYVMTNSELDIDKIIAKNGRKRVISFDFKSVEICAAVDDFSYKAEFENKEGITRTYDLTGNPADGGVYFADIVTENGKHRILFQPSREMLDAAWKYNPRNVHVKN